MRLYQLQVDYDDGDPDWFVLREFDAQTGRQTAQVLLASDGFELHHLRDALGATDWLSADDGGLTLRPGITAAMVQKVVSEMFEYFSSPDTPSQTLLDVQAVVDACDVVQAARVRIPLFGYAWLDIMVREDLADEARSASNVWKSSRLEVDVQRYRQRRVEQLVQRYASEAALGSANRMARSTRRRPPNDQASKLG